MYLQDGENKLLRLFSNYVELKINCTRFLLSFSLLHDEPQKRFKHARSLFLRTNALFI